MAAGDEFIVGLLTPQAITATSTTQEHPLGAHGFDVFGNEFVYLKGVASTIAGSFVHYDSDGATTLVTTTTVLVANNRGQQFAIAQSANVASQYAWYAVKVVRNPNSTYKACVLANAAKGQSLYATTTAGYLDDSATQAGRVVGVRLTTANGGTDAAVTTFTCAFLQST